MWKSLTWSFSARVRRGCISGQSVERVVEKKDWKTTNGWGNLLNYSCFCVAFLVVLIFGSGVFFFPPCFRYDSMILWKGKAVCPLVFYCGVCWKVCQIRLEEKQSSEESRGYWSGMNSGRGLCWCRKGGGGEVTTIPIAFGLILLRLCYL